MPRLGRAGHPAALATSRYSPAGDGAACEPDGGNGDCGELGNNNDGGVYYAKCDAVRAASKDPIRRGDPGYSRRLDRDGDGMACE
ncbi:excalibur calcium-binding domain-containing protein [Micromonospora sp. NPDC049051]|uniref:excalibur calcium-binding domain-containing protein n=1 Tax=Micromonospora sp. NPDC049051 TaxID=3364264 RepID=UPI00372296A2